MPHEPGHQDNSTMEAILAAVAGLGGDTAGMQPIGVPGRTFIDETGQPGFTPAMFYDGMQNELLYGTISPEIINYDELLQAVRDAAVAGGFLKASDLPPLGEQNEKLDRFINIVFARANEIVPDKATQNIIMETSGFTDPKDKALYLYKRVLTDALENVMLEPPKIEVTPYLAPDPQALKQSVKGYMRQRLGRDASDAEMRNLTAILAGEYKLQYQNQIQNEIANTEFVPVNSTNIEVNEDLTNYDPQANFVEQFERLYENDISYVDRVAAERASFAQFRQALSQGANFMAG
tara:strand:- start:7752 stop:8627 length:876 start_codon:yes stop_codon:yes gene_type:complete